jgi:hypothetical protein
VQLGHISQEFRGVPGLLGGRRFVSLADHEPYAPTISMREDKEQRGREKGRERCGDGVRNG